MSYEPLKQVLARIGEREWVKCVDLLEKNRERITKAQGSSHNHQAWEGGYLDHVTEVMNIAVFLFEAMNKRRPLPFTLQSALLVLFLHDIEKPWKQEAATKWTKVESRAFREKLLVEYGITLTEDERNALTYVEGEGDDYSSTKRVMGPLAAFCHLCDVTSARIWFDEPKASGPWPSEGESARTRALKYVARQGPFTVIRLPGDGTAVTLNFYKDDPTQRKAQYADALWIVEKLLSGGV